MDKALGWGHGAADLCTIPCEGIAQPRNRPPQFIIVGTIRYSIHTQSVQALCLCLNALWVK